MAGLTSTPAIAARHEKGPWSQAISAKVPG
jgi:hypothetical protein